MEYRPTALHKAIDAVKRTKTANGKEITEEDMARKMGVSVEQFYAYLRGEEVPPGFPEKLEIAYNIQIVSMQHTVVKQPPKHDAPKSESGNRTSLEAIIPPLDAVQMEANRASLLHSIQIVRNRGLAKDRDISIEEMAGQMNLSEEQLYAYVSGEYKTMEDFASRLRTVYRDLMGDGRTDINQRVYLDKNARRIRLT
jgi:transcriptional regulator with XRE-family HTH domain